MAGKRANGEGTLYRRASDGRWLGSIQFGHDDRGRPIRKYVSANTEREALRKLRALSRLRDDGLPPPSDRTKFGDLLPLLLHTGSDGMRLEQLLVSKVNA